MQLTSVLARRMILSYLLIGLVTGLTAGVSFAYISNKANIVADFHEDAFFKLLQIDRRVNNAAQELFFYVLSGVEEELEDHHAAIEALPSDLAAFASTANFLAAGEKSERALFLELKRHCGLFTDHAAVVVAEYQRDGVVSLVSIHRVEEALDSYQAQATLLQIHEQIEMVEARARQRQVIEVAKSLLAVVFVIFGLTLLVIGSFVIKKVTGLVKGMQVSEHEIQARLKVKVAQRTAELSATNVQLVAADRAKDEFLACMSHEIRTPMNGVIGMTELLLNTELSSNQLKFVKTARHSASLLFGVINDILDFSKIDAGKLVLDPIQFDLRSSIEETIDLIAIQAEDKGVELILNYPRALPRMVVGDSFRLSQILLNLMSNAVKFTDEGHILITVEVTEQTEGNAALKFSVEDTGIGLTDEAKANIFNSFTQADQSTTRRYGGTGLGLTISKKLVNMMEGDLAVNSVFGEGSTFHFTVLLPVIEHVSESQEKIDSGVLDDALALIVDDNKVNRNVLEGYIEHWGLKSDSVASGVEALKALRRAAEKNEPYDLALLDFNMPEMDGLTLGKLIVKDPVLSKTKIIMLTSVNHQQQFQDFLASGFSAYVVKPLRQSKLLDTIMDAMKESKKLIISEDSHIGRPIPKTIPALRILLAEDNHINQQVAVHMLQILGQTVTVAENGLVALKKLEEQEFDLIFMDCRMPKMDGFEATKRIRNNEKFAKIPIVAMTANASTQDRDECLSKGMDDYVSKPFIQTDLGHILRTWTAKKSKSGPITVNDVQLNLLDLSLLARLKGGQSPEQYHDFISDFLQEMADLSDVIKEAIDGQDSVRSHESAHTLNSVAANMGAPRLSQSALQIEVESEKRDWPEMLRLHMALKNTIAETSRVYEDYRDSLRDTS
jgi:signal transduction histidine kinase/DNA-binding response OmpR family regulator